MNNNEQAKNPTATNEEQAAAANDEAIALQAESRYSEAAAAAAAALAAANAANSPLQQGRALNNLGRIELVQGNPQSALQYFLQALAKFESLHDSARTSVVMGNIGIVHRSLSDYGTAIEYYRKALAIDEKLANPSGMAKHIGNIGNVYFELADYSTSLEYYRQALALAEESGNMSDAALNITNIGNVYRSISNHAEALEYFNKALEIQTSLGNRLGVAVCIDNIAGSYFFVPDYPKALEHYRQALAIYQDVGHKNRMADANGNIGLVSQYLENYPLALQHYRQALELYEEMQSKVGTAFIIGKIGSVLGELQYAEYNPDKAKEYLLKALELNEQLGAKQELYQNHAMLAELYRQTGDGLKAYDHHRQFHELEKEVQNEQTRRQAEQLRHQRQTAEQEKLLAVERARHDATEKLLHNTLPPQIVRRLLANETMIADYYGSISVLFMDIVNFTPLASRIPPKPLVYVLAAIFSKADAVVEQFGLEKIKTIGDSYMAVCGAPEPCADHACRMAFAGITLIEEMKNLTVYMPEELGETSWLEGLGEIEVRIGLHSGEAVGGVIGQEKFQYDIWGDAVNTASRMESHGAPGKIHVSERFKNAVQSFPSPDLGSGVSLEFIERGEMEIKGKGKMRTYFLENSANPISAES